ncbi:MAG: hypothetical protein EOO46_10690 [Flavobacterium sp.]|nr:MAG: hypothetical protein EOO46_10690 [Flavobacterium sp.]
MNTDDHKNNRDDQPRDINPDEIGYVHPSKKIKSQEKIDIKESEFGRDFSNFQQDEHIEDAITQIDKGTIKLQEEKKENPDGELKDEINEDDNRDHNDSTEDWDAENSRTGRHK